MNAWLKFNVKYLSNKLSEGWQFLKIFLNHLCSLTSFFILVYKYYFSSSLTNVTNDSSVNTLSNQELYLGFYFENILSILLLPSLLVRWRNKEIRKAGEWKKRFIKRWRKEFFFSLPAIHRGGLLSVTPLGPGPPGGPQRSRRVQPGGRWASPPGLRSPQRILWQRNELQPFPSAPRSP